MKKILFFLLLFSNQSFAQCSGTNVFDTWQAPTISGQDGELTTSTIQTTESIIVQGIVEGCTYLFSTCNGSENTNLTLYNGNTAIAFNDNNGPDCGTSSASIQWTATFTGNVEVVVCGLTGINFDLSLQLVSCSGVEISENTQSEINLTLFPNPVNDALYFFSQSYIPDLSITITNFQGKLIEIVSKNDINAGQIDFTGKPTGLYFYTITSKNQIIKTGKFIKQ